MRGRGLSSALVVPTLASVLALAAVLATARDAHAELELKWNVEGFYRMRALSITNLAPEPRTQIIHPAFDLPVTIPEIRNQSYMIHRLQLNPQLAYGTIAKLNLQIDALQDVLWGDNNGLALAPLFATVPSNQYYMGGPGMPQYDVGVTRAWMEFAIPIGVLRVGRMPSHWGLGLLSNGGGSGNWDPTAPKGERRHVQDYYFDDDFGDNHFGNTFDRILFATRPLTILKTIQKKADTRSNFIFAMAYDKLSESPLYPEADRRLRPYGQTGFISREAPSDDANEYVLVLAYSDPDWDKVAITDELKFGTYQLVRTQGKSFSEPSRGPPYASPEECAARNIPEDECVLEDEGSLVWAVDLWYRVRYGSWYSEGEYFHVGGDSTGGVPFPIPNRKTKVDIDAGVIRGGYLTELWDALFEAGFAGGDDNMGDATLTQRPLHPDHNVGLVLFEEVLRERSARVFGPPFYGPNTPDGAFGLMSNGGVVSSKYLQLKGRYRPGIAGIEVIGAVMGAWLDKFSEPPNLFVCPDSSVLAADCRASKYLGTEIDLAVKSRFADEHMDLSLEMGYLHFGDALKVKSDGSGPIPNAPSGAFSLQMRAAFIF